MKFRDLQRFFSGELTEKEEIILFGLLQNMKEKEILAGAVEEGWIASADRKVKSWDPGPCYNKILKKITLNNH